MKINYKERTPSKRNNTTDRFYLSTAWKKKRKEILERDGYLCQCDRCKTKPVPLIANVVDHIIQRSKGGADLDNNNLQSMHPSCHQRKSANERHNK